MWNHIYLCLCIFEPLFLSSLLWHVGSWGLVVFLVELSTLTWTWTVQYSCPACSIALHGHHLAYENLDNFYRESAMADYVAQCALHTVSSLLLCKHLDMNSAGLRYFFFNMMECLTKPNKSSTLCIFHVMTDPQATNQSTIERCPYSFLKHIDDTRTEVMFFMPTASSDRMSHSAWSRLSK